jgi:hypothetical protein
MFELRWLLLCEDSARILANVSIEVSVLPPNATKPLAMSGFAGKQCVIVIS